MSISPIISKITPSLQELQKEGHKIVQSITSNPGPKMGAWTMRGYGIQAEATGQTIGALTAEVGKKINKLG